MNLNSNVSPKKMVYMFIKKDYTLSTLDQKRRIFMYLTWFWIQNSWISPRCEKRIMCIAFHKSLWNNTVYRRIINCGVSLIFATSVVEFKIMQVLLAFSQLGAFFIEMYRISLTSCMRKSSVYVYALYFTMLCFKRICV